MGVAEKLKTLKTLKGVYGNIDEQEIRSEFPEQLGKKMVELVLRRIAKPDLPGRDIRLDFELVIRDSSPS